jgi:hypothetical protein
MEEYKRLVQALQNKCKLLEREVGMLQQEVTDKEKQIAAQKGYVQFLKTKLREAVEDQTPATSTAQ